MQELRRIVIYAKKGGNLKCDFFTGLIKNLFSNWYRNSLTKKENSIYYDISMVWNITVLPLK